MRVLLILAGAAMLSSCVMTKEMTEKLNVTYSGKNTDEFFLKYGLPAAKQQMNSGDIIYVWDSGATTFTSPTTTTMTSRTQGTMAGNYGSGVANGNYIGTTTTNAVSTGGGTVVTRCRVQILSSPEGVVRDIKIIENTIGNWLPSRCDEVLF